MAFTSQYLNNNAKRFDNHAAVFISSWHKTESPTPSHKGLFLCTSCTCSSCPLSKQPCRSLSRSRALCALKRAYGCRSVGADDCSVRGTDAVPHSTAGDGTDRQADSEVMERGGAEKNSSPQLLAEAAEQEVCQWACLWVSVALAQSCGLVNTLFLLP